MNIYDKPISANNISLPIYRSASVQIYSRKFKKSALCVDSKTHCMFNSCSQGSGRWQSFVSYFWRSYFLLFQLLTVVVVTRAKGTWSAALCGSFCLAAEALSWSLPKHWLTAYRAAMTKLLYPPRTPLTQLSCWNTRPFLESEIELVLRRTQWLFQWWTLTQAITS